MEQEANWTKREVRGAEQQIQDCESYFMCPYVPLYMSCEGKHIIGNFSTSKDIIMPLLNIFSLD